MPPGMGASMLPEPSVACPRGHLTCTLEQGAAQGMRCRVCGETLERADARWLTPGRKNSLEPALAWTARLDHKVGNFSCQPTARWTRRR
jgi:hypothetical protein